MLRAVPPGKLLRSVPDASTPEARTDAELVAELRREVAGLHQAMESRATIEQAKGMVMLCYGLPPDQAFAMMVRWSSLGNVKLRCVAASLARLALQAPLDDAGPVLAGELASELQGPFSDRPAPAS